MNNQTNTQPDMNTEPAQRRYNVALTITFTVEVEASTPEEAIEHAHLAAVCDGYPETQQETVYNIETGDILLDQRG